VDLLWILCEPAVARPHICIERGWPTLHGPYKICLNIRALKTVKHILTGKTYRAYKWCIRPLLHKAYEVADR